jgi:hypothetical protein
MKTVEYNGVKYKLAEEERKATIGQAIIITGNTSYHDLGVGDVATVTRIYEHHVMTCADEVSGEHGVFHSDYRVLIPLETDMDELLEINANLIRRVFELEAGQRGLFEMVERDKARPEVTYEVDTYFLREMDEGESADNVNSPAHYNSGKYEVIDVIEDALKEGFEPYCIGNVMKYVSRYKHKNGVEDLRKAAWYLGRVIETLDS